MMNKGLNTWNFWTLVRECKNVASWDIELAIEWMKEARKQIKNEMQQKYWEQTATEINFKLAKSKKSAIVEHGDTREPRENTPILRPLKLTQK